MTKGQQAIRQLAAALNDTTGNLPSLPAVYPDYDAPIVRVGEDGARVLTSARWGMPSPTFALKGRKVDKGVTNIRNLASPHWRRWLGVTSRCLVPFDAFSENARDAEGRVEPVWFAFDDTRPLAFFAGIWTRWTSTRKIAEGEVTLDQFGFLTTDANAEVGSVHPKAMPVILRSQEERDLWLSADWPAAAARRFPFHHRQRPKVTSLARYLTSRPTSAVGNLIRYSAPTAERAPLAARPAPFHSWT